MALPEFNTTAAVAALVVFIAVVTIGYWLLIGRKRNVNTMKADLDEE